MKSVVEHPSEEMLAEVALGEGTETAIQHVQSCQQCSESVEQIKSIKDAIVSLPDEEMPHSVRHNILQRKKPKGFSIFSKARGLSNFWLSNPLVLTISFVLFLIFLYFFIVFVLK